MKFSSSLVNILLMLLVGVALNPSVNHISAADQFGNETDRLALLQFKLQISDDPNGALDSWNHSEHHCQWRGVTCDIRHQRVTALSITGKDLSGSLSPHIGNLSFMKSIQLGGNLFHGEIPREFGRLFRLRFLNLSSNILTGQIPANLSHCSQMTTISLSRNKLQGKIPVELLNLKKLENLYLFINNLTGEIPSFIGNMSSLMILNLAFNNFTGNLPKELGSSTSLSTLVVSANQLSGIIPATIYNISTVTNFLVGGNFFYGSIPANIGLTLKNLRRLSFGQNEFSGNIPVSITNASGLEVLDLPDNKFEGQVPTNIGDLSNVRILNLGANRLGSNSTGDLSFISSLTNNTNLISLDIDSNRFGGRIPMAIANLSHQLNELGMGLNQLSGTIPEGFGKFSNLYVLDMSSNLLSGEFPSDFGEFQNLQFLGIERNNLSGEILSNLCNVTTLYHLDISSNQFESRDIFDSILMNCQNLQQLDISRNKLSGVVPPNFFIRLSSLIHIDIGHNMFSGSIPPEVGKLIHLIVFNVSYNKFSGEIPATLVQCLDLNYLHMEANIFHGMIPPKLASLRGIQELDLSSNNLTGQIPRGLEKLGSLKYLNLSYNDLEGEVPSAGIFANASRMMLIGNHRLCGGIPKLDLSTCPVTVIEGKNKGKHKVLILILSIVLPVMILVIGSLLLYYVIYQRRYRRKTALSTVFTGVDKYLRVSYRELYHATSGFSAENLIGSGSFGSVYRARLDQHGGRLVAVKVLDIQRNGASKSFKAECRALRNIRHRNLVSLLTYCSSIDSKGGQEFKALIYEFMENGSLDMWLHPDLAETTRSRNLNLQQRLNIAIDVASAVDYLHNHSHIAIVHCDLKSSNILLDKDLTAHVGDFGLARLLPKTKNNSAQHGTASSSAGVKGTVGYAAPEYGFGMEVSTEGDVYSYGILLLEMFTGRRPTDDTFVDNLDLHNYVKNSLPGQIWKILDPSILPKEIEGNREVFEAVAKGEETNCGERVMEKSDGDMGNLSYEIKKVQKCLISIFQVGLGCSQRSTKDRLDMKEVTRELHLIRDAFLNVKLDMSCIGNSSGELTSENFE